MILKETEIRINILKEVHIRIAAERAMLYFLLISLCKVDPMYQYSLKIFTKIFFKAIIRKEVFKNEEPRVWI